MPKIDLHVHSNGSPDGSITLGQIGRMLRSERLDYIAITDHDSIAQAVLAQQRYGDKIIVGQEISTSSGELIGLFLTEPIKPGLSPEATAMEIKRQNGLVYVPHPFETLRKGLQIADLEMLLPLIDIVETHNGRALAGRKTAQSSDWAAKHDLPAAASSDAHGRLGWGRTYSEINHLPSALNLPRQLKSGRLHYRRPHPLALGYPKLNRLRKRHV